MVKRSATQQASSNHHRHHSPSNDENNREAAALMEMQRKHLLDIKEVLKKTVENVKNCNENDTVEVEVEAKLGSLLGNNKFTPGIGMSEFTALKAYFDELPDDDFEKYFEPQVDYVYRDKGTLRVNFLDDNPQKTPTRVLKKTKLHQACLMSKKMWPYDVKITVATEMDLKTTTNFQKDSYHMIRKKDRWSYEGKDFRIDLTKVVISKPTHTRNNTTNNYSSEEVYEVEFEMDSSTTKQLAEGDTEVERISDLFYNTITQFLKVLENGRKIISSGSACPYPELNLCPNIDSDLEVLLKSHLAKAIGVSEIKDFPGSMPVTFCRAHFSNIISNDYYVSEKTDGLRYLLLISPDGIYLIDRKLVFFPVHYEILLTVFSQDDKVSLIDGELIKNKTTQKIIFLIFDVIQLNGISCAGEKLDKRLDIIGNKIIIPYREATKDMTDLPFLLLGKRICKKDKISDLLSCISQIGKDGERYYMDKVDKNNPGPPKRHHKTDGIIFTPNEPYNYKTTNNLYKWKFLDRQSIDFRAKKRDDNVYQLSCLVAGGEEFVCFECSFSESDLKRLEKDWQTHNRQHDAIIECIYDKNIGEWTYQTLRADKKTPNYIRIVFDTLFAQAEGITKDDIVNQIIKNKK